MSSANYPGGVRAGAGSVIWMQPARCLTNILKVDRECLWMALSAQPASKPLFKDLVSQQYYALMTALFL